MKRTVFFVLALIVILFASISWLSVTYPETVSTILNIFWLTLLVTVIIFFALGFLVIFGLRQEVNKLLDIFLEGSLNLVDVAALIKRLWHQFIATLKEFLLFLAPLLAYCLAIFAYVLLLYAYKTVGRDHDVMPLTVALTVLLIAIIGLLNLPKKTDTINLAWAAQFRQRFIVGLSDSFEVIILLFFLTMDSVNLFFLPKELNVPIFSKIGDYDLMKRGFVVNNHLRITVNLIIVAIITEIVRNSLRIIAVAVYYYRQRNYDVLRSVAFKSAVRKSFNEARDDIVKFISFTTLLVAAFLLFPRLKLLAMAVASVTSLALDILIPHRLTQVKGTDLLSRILTKVFKL